MKRSASARRGERGLGASCPCAPGGHRHLHPLRAGAVPASGLHPSRGEHPLRAACCLPLLAPAAGSSAAAPRPAPGTGHRAPGEPRGCSPGIGGRPARTPRCPPGPARPGTARYLARRRVCGAVRCRAVLCRRQVPAGCRGSCGLGVGGGKRGRVRSFSLLFPRAPLFITGFPDHPTDTVPPSSSPRCRSRALALPLPPARPPLPCAALAPRCPPPSGSLPGRGGVRVPPCTLPTPSPAARRSRASSPLRPAGVGIGPLVGFCGCCLASPREPV